MAEPRARTRAYLAGSVNGETRRSIAGYISARSGRGGAGESNRKLERLHSPHAPPFEDRSRLRVRADRVPHGSFPPPSLRYSRGSVGLQASRAVLWILGSGPRMTTSVRGRSLQEPLQLAETQDGTGRPQHDPHAEVTGQSEGLEASGGTLGRHRAPPALALRGALAPTSGLTDHRVPAWQRQSPLVEEFSWKALGRQTLQAAPWILGSSPNRTTAVSG
jgi:hypothetical protein